MALLITEDNFQGVRSGHVIDEASGSKNYYIEGIFLQAEQKNRNGRIYPANILEREVQRFKTDYIDKHRSLGELNHPKEPTVNPERACHLIESLRPDGSNNWVGKSKVLSTPIGSIVKGLLEDGVQLGVSSRGLGTLTTNKSGTKVVNEDYYMSTIDVVSDPSAHDAWVNGIFEGKEFYVAGNEEFVESIKNKINIEASKVGFSKVQEEVALRYFQEFINHLKG